MRMLCHLSVIGLHDHLLVFHDDFYIFAGLQFQRLFNRFGYPQNERLAYPSKLPFQYYFYCLFFERNRLPELLFSEFYLLALRAFVAFTKRAVEYLHLLNLHIPAAFALHFNRPNTSAEKSSGEFLARCLPDPACFSSVSCRTGIYIFA